VESRGSSPCLIDHSRGRGRAEELPHSSQKRLEWATDPAKIGLGWATSDGDSDCRGGAAAHPGRIFLTSTEAGCPGGHSGVFDRVGNLRRGERMGRDVKADAGFEDGRDDREDREANAVLC
jgi:hypothetical protein